MMHAFEPHPEAYENTSIPRLGDFRFNDALDVVEFVRHDPWMGSQTWPEVWHLDEAGEFRCGYRGSSLSSIRRWADDPSDLQRSRWVGLREGECPDRWLIIEPRPTWLRATPTVDEGDAEALFRLREALEAVEVRLVDAVILDDKHHWWSMHELTTGSTRW